VLGSLIKAAAGAGSLIKAVIQLHKADGEPGFDQRNTRGHGASLIKAASEGGKPGTGYGFDQRFSGGSGVG